MEAAATRLKQHQFCLTIATTNEPVANSTAEHLSLALDQSLTLSGYASGPVTVLERPDSLLLLFGQLQDSRYPEPLPTLASQLEQGNNRFAGELDGLFALLFYQRSSQQLRLFSDRVGNYRLFYRQQPQQLTVSSDFRLLSNREQQPDPVWLNQMLHYRISAGFNSMNTQIHCLPASHMASFASLQQAPKLTAYWQMPERQPEPGVSLEQRVEQTQQALLDALRSSGISNKKTAVLLSGGVDSALLLALVKQLNPEVLAITPRFTTGDNPELDTAIQLAASLGVEHQCINITDAQVVESFQRVVSLLAQPPRSHSTLALDQLFKQLSGRFEAVVFGEAADTLFGSKLIRTTLNQIDIARQTGVKPWLIQLAARFSNHPRLQARASLQRMSLLQHIESAWQLDFQPATQSQLPGQQAILAQMDITGRLRQAIADKQADTPQQLAALVRHFLLSVDVYNHFYCVGSLARNWGLELVSPFIHSQVTQLANQLSDQHYHHQDTAKPVLKALACRYFPDELIYQPKQGFPVPYAHWLAGPLRQQADAARALISNRFNPAMAQDNELVWTMVGLRELLSDAQLDQALNQLTD